MEIIKYPTQSDWKNILKRPAINNNTLEETVLKVMQDVKLNGEDAIKKYTLQFDKVTITELLVSEKEFDEAEKKISAELKSAIAIAKNNIEKFHSSQIEEAKVIETSNGVKCWRKSVAIQKVGLYIPGGTAPLFSTILMLGIPANIAGCKEIILCTPPNAKGEINEAILYTAKLLGIKKVFKIGGVQAIAAMAYGTDTIPQVYKLFGPGNQYVTCAKQLASKQGVAIDMPAGPSELAILADDSCIPKYVAADLLSQAEHGEDSQVILVSDNLPVINEIILELYTQLELLPRKTIAQKALLNSKAILVKNNKEGVNLLNEYAPEHLIIAVNNYETLANEIVNAGSVFLGNYSCESAGDYTSGTNHTLPTNGYAKAYSGVSLDSFVKKITFQHIDKQGLQQIGPAIEIMADTEGLQAHKNAVTIRINN